MHKALLTTAVNIELERQGYLWKRENGVRMVGRSTV